MDFFDAVYINCCFPAWSFTTTDTDSAKMSASTFTLPLQLSNVSISYLSIGLIGTVFLLFATLVRAYLRYKPSPLRRFSFSKLPHPNGGNPVVKVSHQDSIYDESPNTTRTDDEIAAYGRFPDYAALSGVPLPTAYPKFDIIKALPRPYRPFRWAYHQTMCMSFL